MGRKGGGRVGATRRRVGCRPKTLGRPKKQALAHLRRLCDSQLMMTRSTPVSPPPVKTLGRPKKQAAAVYSQLSIGRTQPRVGYCGFACPQGCDRHNAPDANMASDDDDSDDSCVQVTVTHSPDRWKI